VLIPFNKPYLSGKETDYIREATLSGKISGDGMFTKRCHQYFEQRYGFHKCLLTTSCTDALEMAAILLNIQPGDEVIMPSFTFVSTANAFVLRGARIVFADSEAQTPNLDAGSLESLITVRTKAIVVVHYAGMACDMDPIMALARNHELYVVEDAAQAIDSFYKGRPLGSIGHLAAFSFHETKNIISGEGGMLVINDAQFDQRAEIIREKGTNRSAFFRGEVDKYGWVDIGSSFLPSEIIAAFLFAQLENLDRIQQRRKAIWQQYDAGLQRLAQQGWLSLPQLTEYASNNGHLYYVLCRNLSERTQLIEYMREAGILTVFHYLSLHQSSFYAQQHDGRSLPHSDHYSDCLLRLPLYYELEDGQVQWIVNKMEEFFQTIQRLEVIGLNKE
jgi:dTDP-4-amino-4,6-dideoxygalactose transaminase